MTNCCDRKGLIRWLLSRGCIFGAHDCLWSESILTVGYKVDDWTWASCFSRFCVCSSRAQFVVLSYSWSVWRSLIGFVTICWNLLCLSDTEHPFLDVAIECRQTLSIKNVLSTALAGAGAGACGRAWPALFYLVALVEIYFWLFWKKLVFSSAILVKTYDEEGNVLFQVNVRLPKLDALGVKIDRKDPYSRRTGKKMPSALW